MSRPERVIHLHALCVQDEEARVKAAEVEKVKAGPDEPGAKVGGGILVGTVVW